VPGSSMRAAAREVAAAGAEIQPWILILLSKWMRVETSIKAGSYEITRGITPLELLNKLTRGDVTPPRRIWCSSKDGLSARCASASTPTPSFATIRLTCRKPRSCD